MKLTDFPDLATAQDYPVEDETHQVGSGTARGWFVFTGIWTTLRTIQDDKAHPLYALADAVIATATDASSYFGLDPNKADGVANRGGLATLVSAGVMTQPQADEFIAKSITVTKPFKDVTQTEFDRAQLTKTPTTIETTYDSGNAISKSNSIGVYVDIAEALQFDDKFIVYAHSKKPTDDTFAQDTRPRGHIYVKAGQTGRIKVYGGEVNVSGLDNDIKFFVASQYQRTFTAKASVNS